MLSKKSQSGNAINNIELVINKDKIKKVLKWKDPEIHPILSSYLHLFSLYPNIIVCMHYYCKDKRYAKIKVINALPLICYYYKHMGT